MRLLEALSYGTEQYPSKVARRLRVLNITCWSTALVWLGFAVFYLPDFKLRTVVLIDMGDRRVRIPSDVDLSAELVRSVAAKAVRKIRIGTVYPATIGECRYGPKAIVQQVVARFPSRRTPPQRRAFT